MESQEPTTPPSGDDAPVARLEWAPDGDAPTEVRPLSEQLVDTVDDRSATAAETVRRAARTAWTWLLASDGLATLPSQ